MECFPPVGISRKSWTNRINRSPRRSGESC